MKHLKSLTAAALLLTNGLTTGCHTSLRVAAPVSPVVLPPTRVVVTPPPAEPVVVKTAPQTVIVRQTPQYYYEYRDVIVEDRRWLPPLRWWRPWYRRPRPPRPVVRHHTPYFGRPYRGWGRGSR